MAPGTSARWTMRALGKHRRREQRDQGACAVLYGEQLVGHVYPVAPYEGAFRASLGGDEDFWDVLGQAPPVDLGVFKNREDAAQAVQEAYPAQE